MNYFRKLGQVKVCIMKNFCEIKEVSVIIRGEYAMKVYRFPFAKEKSTTNLIKISVRYTSMLT
jgi:hypothetical protein